MPESERNPLSIKETVAANGDPNMPDSVVEHVEQLVDLMASLTQRHRVVVFQILTDFYCPRCGVEQPYGDCQCGQPR